MSHAVKVIRPQALQKFASELLQRGIGCHAGEADEVARHLVRANLTGHDSHGVGMLPRYFNDAKKGLLVPNAELKVDKNEGFAVVVDGQRGFGQRVTRDALDLAIQRAKTNGISVLALRNAFHIGRIGTYGEQAAEEGLFSMHFVNVYDEEPLVAPFGGSDGRTSTNPVCIAIPSNLTGGPGAGSVDGRDRTDDQGRFVPHPVLLDFATSKAALGKARVAMAKGEKLRANSAIDAEGLPTTDPSVMFPSGRHTASFGRDAGRGSLCPVGDDVGYKGSGLAVMCEMLAGALGGLGHFTNQDQNPRQGGIINNMFSVLIDPQHLAPNSAVQEEVHSYVKYYQASEPAPESFSEGHEKVMVPGESELYYATEREEQGIPIDTNTWGQLSELGVSAGVTVPEHN